MADHELRQLLIAKNVESLHRRSTIDDQAAAATFHAVRGDTVLITVAVDNPLLTRSVAIQWHGTGDAGTPAAECHTLTYNFVADRPGTFTFRARYGRNRPAYFTDAQGREAWPSTSEHARTDAGHHVRVPRSHTGPSSRRRTGTAPREDEGRTANQELVYVHGGWGHACIEAQLMAGNTTIYLNDEGLVRRLLRWSAVGLTAAAVWVSGLCGGRHDPAMRRRGDRPLVARFVGRASPHVSRAPSLPQP
ncbi:hypothetical protein ZWY2020_054413 [Hordeum vulgare]|nr:hypothetical protein ZWY2020_054413 [Hordeum vulgare]